MTAEGVPQRCEFRVRFFMLDAASGSRSSRESPWREALAVAFGLSGLGMVQALGVQVWGFTVSSLFWLVQCRLCLICDQKASEAPHTRTEGCS